MSDAGEIIGRLKLDASQWFAELERAKVSAEELRGIDPRISISADGAAKVVAEIQAVETAAKSLDRQRVAPSITANAASAIAAGRAIVDLQGGVQRALDKSNIAFDGLTAALDRDVAAEALAVAATRSDVAARRDSERAAVEQAAAISAESRQALDAAVAKLRLQGATSAASAAEKDYVKLLDEGKASEAELAAAQNLAVQARTRATELAAAAASGERDLAVAAETAGEKTTDAAKGPIPWMGILVGSIALVSPGIVAVGAAAVGLSAELGGLGIAGILAFKGIAAEIASGSDLGLKYSDMVGGLQADLSLLEHTAAAGIFAGLSAGVKTLEADIGPLNQDVSLLSGQLGGLLATTATTAVHALSGFTPVLIAAGGALQTFLQGVDGFTTSNGFTDFVQYTVARLPDVMHLIDSTLGAIGGLFSALAPGGQSTLFMLSSLMDLITALAPTVGALMPTVIGLSDAIGGIALVVAHVLDAMGPVGPALVGTTAAFIGLGFAAKALAPAVLAAADAEGVAALATRGLGAAVDFAMGPVGLLLIGAGLLASALVTMGNGAADSASSVADLTSALQQDSGVVGQNTLAYLANQSIKSGAADAASRFGISLKTLTAAQAGNATATAQVNKATKDLANTHSYGTMIAQRYHSQLGQQITDAQKVQAAVTSQNSALKQATDQYNKIAQATGQARVSQQQMAAAANALHMPVAEFAAAAAAQAKAADTAQQTRDKYILLGDAANLLKLDMDRLNGASISNAEAQAAWASGLDSLKSSFNATSKAITGNSNAALENRGAVASLAATGETALQSIAGMSHSASQTTAAYKSMRSEMINQVTQLTHNRAAATALVDAYFKIPKNVKTDFQGDDADAKAKAAAAKKAGEDFAKGDYKAALKADPSPANKAKADAMSKAEAFAKAQYEAKYAADPSNANKAAMEAAAKAHWFGNGYYWAYLNAHNGPAMNAIQAVRYGLQNLNGTTADVYIRAIQTGSVPSRAAQIARNAGYADGGTIPGLASGGSGFSGTVSGAGNSWNDMAGMFRLANGEEVTSNIRGQADAFRGVLKAINTQKVKTPAQLGQMLGGGSGDASHVVVHVIGDDSALASLVSVQVQSGLTAQQARDARTLRMGWQGKGLLAAPTGA